MTTLYPTASAGALVAALAAREVTALDLLETAIARIEALDGPINAVVVRDFDRARQAATEADAALDRGERAPLLGLPMTVKEGFHVEGLPTTWGFRAFEGWTPPYEATTVTRLKAAGAVILGKTNVPVALADWQSDNPIYGRCNNPYDLTRTPGGSSGGSAAALAAGFTPLELGSDIGGSIRVPAHFCGVCGHKPSFGLVPMTGHAPPGIASPGGGVELVVAGPMARTAADLDLGLSVLAGPDGPMAKGYRLDLAAPRADHLSGFRVLVLDRHPSAPADDEVVAALDALAERLAKAGASVVRAHPRLPDLAKLHEAYATMLMTISFLGAPGAPPAMDAYDWMRALDAMARARRAWEGLFQDIDVVIAPPLGVAAFAHDERPYDDRSLSVNGAATSYFGQMAWPGLASYPGLPATCIPAGRTAAGLPVGVQIIGPFLEDRTTIALAALIEREWG